MRVNFLFQVTVMLKTKKSKPVFHLEQTTFNLDFFIASEKLKKIAFLFKIYKNLNKI